MSLTLDKQRTALLCLHLQNDIVDENGALAKVGFTTAQMVANSGMLPRAARLQNAARKAGVGVYHVAVAFRPDYSDATRSSALLRACIDASSLVEGTWGADFPASVAPRDGEAVVINKATGAFTTSDLRERIAPLGLTTLLLTGVATNFVVESTAREGSDLGYEVVVVKDCCAGPSEAMHDAALNTSLPFLATIAELADVEAALQ